MSAKISKTTKQLKIYAHHSKRNGIGNGVFVPEIKFSGKWLEDLGFAIGDNLNIEVTNGVMTLRPEGRAYASA